jgi:DNA invertase Pin-like site-specific DNA recombinase
MDVNRRKLKATIAAIESSSTVQEAAEKLEVGRMTIYNRIGKNGYKIIKSHKLKVVKNDSQTNQTL